MRMRAPQFLAPVKNGSSSVHSILSPVVEWKGLRRDESLDWSNLGVSYSPITYATVSYSAVT